MPFQIGPVQFRWDTFISTVALMLTFVCCTVFLETKLTSTAKENRLVMIQMSGLLKLELERQGKVDTLVDTRLSNIESRLTDQLTELGTEQHMIVELEMELSRETRNRKSGAGTVK